MNLTEDVKVGQIVAKDFRTASIFNKYGIDFCCNGGISLESACNKKGIRFELLLDEIQKTMISTEKEVIDYKSWPLDKLINHIETIHHQYVRTKIPVILQFLTKICSVHGDRHPELYKISEIFKESARDLNAHMFKEETILFPIIKKMCAAEKQANESFHQQFGTVHNPIQMMMQEHATEGDRFEEISNLSQNYNIPDDGCTTYKVVFEMLKDFEQDLHLHIHLENNILFPAAVSLESKLLSVTRL